MAEYGIKVSRSGYDVYDADTDELSVTSGHASRSVKMEGTVDVTTTNDGNWAIATVTHNFGYTPQVDVFTDLELGGTVSLPGTFYFKSTDETCIDGGGQPYDFELFYIAVSSTTLTVAAMRIFDCFDIFHDLTYLVHSYTFHYKIYMEKVDL